jgi:eukaryotic-like serine/threonine-protein kinase
MTSVAPSEKAAEGSVIANKYRLDRLLGEGGMGSVWQAFNLQLEVAVAIKLLRADLDEAELGERLRIEARAAAKLTHPSIVRVFDVGETEWGDPFIVMELLRGESLWTLLEQGALAATDALQLLLPIAEALALAHSRGIVHRDLKPENIFLTRDDNGIVQPKLLDFGIAKVMSGGTTGARALTQTGTLLGSPDYMSPEQAYGRADLDERTDVWSFCVVLYEALARRTPFAGENCSAVLRNVVGSEPVPLEAFGVETELALLVARGLSKDREERPASILELGRELAMFLVMRGVLQDVTGSSLQVKWLGRWQPPSQPTAPESASLAALGEQATLRSVTRPNLRSSSEPIVLETRQRGRRRMLSTAVVVTALAGGGAWASWDRSAARLRSVGAAGPEAAAYVEAPHPLPILAAPPAVVAVDAAPAVPHAAVLGASPARKPPPLATQPTTFHVAPAPATSALPRALPARNSKLDLLNPY